MGSSPALSMWSCRRQLRRYWNKGFSLVWLHLLKGDREESWVLIIAATIKTFDMEKLLDYKP